MAEATRSKKPLTRDKVAHIRFSAREFSAVQASATQAGSTISAFVRSLTLEGAGVRPFLTESDRLVLALLWHDLMVVADRLNQITRALNTQGRVPADNILPSVTDARAVAIAVAAELASMTRRAAIERIGRASS